ncbi:MULTISPECIES: ABC transporter ATP-binding protein [Myxococcus]|uniref:ABC transporter n=1 Tax=Myxococcus xanthus TaxID=34 RepID=A0AAE6FUA5_MYXXA|nr:MULTISPECIES: ABC transporter ATP-binding protein [Myxococcus]QDE65555.1 ABC transporter [Myxococcus xanthus]QDE72828.1 ABC transporter [Myxococcus xanthus]QDE80106.1 ABC transporter [Myxococcus xanthus]QDE94418.1 ABC transporter [Myxococcus xanthus]QDF01642.1 ABC transporter [Myxococcus xanthus]
MLRALLGRWRSSLRLLQPAHVGAERAKISVARLDHEYANKVVALQNVDLNVRSGEFVCLLGPSGCGKSTLLYALAGHVVPTGGSVSIDRQPIHGPGPDRLLMFQEAALFPWLTVRGNITFALAARGVPRAERRERADTYIQRVQLGGFEDALPHQLSGGMKMRASLARALAVDPAVLLMDEPFGSLDAQTRIHMQELLQSIWVRTGKTVVFVTHDVHEALMLGTRVVLMAPRPGRVVRDLEVHLPMPRQPEDAALNEMVRHVGGLLREVEGRAHTRSLKPAPTRAPAQPVLRPQVIPGP